MLRIIQLGNVMTEETTLPEPTEPTEAVITTPAPAEDFADLSATEIEAHRADDPAVTYPVVEEKHGIVNEIENFLNTFEGDLEVKKAWLTQRFADLRAAL